jgi:hypothetical protein
MQLELFRGVLLFLPGKYLYILAMRGQALFLQPRFSQLLRAGNRPFYQTFEGHYSILLTFSQNAISGEEGNLTPFFFFFESFYCLYVPNTFMQFQ